MFLASSDDAPPAADPHVTVTAGDIVDLISADRAPGSGSGRVMRARLSRGGTLELAAGDGRETLIYVIGGDIATDRGAMAADDAVFAPRGAGFALHADTGADLLIVSNAASAAPGGQPQIVSAGTVAPRDVHNPETGFLRMQARWLATGPAVGATEIAVGQSAFAPDGGAHLLHRHAKVAEFLFVLDGSGAHLTQAGEHPMGAGDAALIPAGEWHGFACRGDTPARAVFGYFGVPAPELAGYELHPGVSTETHGPPDR